VYDFIAHWAYDIRLETRLPLVPRRVYPVCLGGKHAAPPEDCRGALAYMERLEHHRLYPPLEAMGVVADAIRTLLGLTRRLRCGPRWAILTTCGRRLTTWRRIRRSNLTTSIVATSTDNYSRGGRRKERCDAGESAGGHDDRR
jgi:hypothetical protein